MRGYASILILTLLAGAAAGGDNNKPIYKAYDAQGHVIFTDQPPNKNAKPLQLKPLNTVPAYVATGKTPAASPPRNATTRYPDLAVTNPLPKETLWNTAGKMPVSVHIAGNLFPGDRLFLVVDGKPQSMSGFRTQLSGLERGTHTVSAQIQGPGGKVQAQTDPFEFYIKQHSIRNRPR